MTESSHEHESQLTDLLLWFGIVLLFVLGLVFAGLPGTPLLPFTKDDPQLVSLLQNVGYGLLGGSLTSAVFKLTTGLADKWQKERTEQALNSLKLNIAKVPEIVSQATSEQQRAIAGQQELILDLSKLLATANSLGIVAIAGDRDGPAFSGMTWAQRWDYLLEHSKRVDLLCWEDTRLFTFARWLTPGPLDRLTTRLESGDLKLRILLSALDNPALDLVNGWIEIPGYMQGNVQKAEDFLRQAGISTRFPVLERHNELLAFSLMRGDDELYIMFFVPKRGPGPIVQVVPPSLHGDAHPAEPTDKSLFEAYIRYFDGLWLKYAPPAAQSDQ